MYSGWVITYDHLNDGDLEIPSRVGWGQINEHSVIAEGEQIIAPSINIREGIDPANIRNRVRFRLVDEDGVQHYAGIISKHWLDSDEVLAFAPLRFATVDTGATIMLYEKEDGSWEHL
jgi:hypothetical protein